MTGAGGLPSFSLDLFGAFRLTGPGGDRIEIPSRKGMALVAMLAVAKDGERARGWLQDKLWGTRGPAQAAGSLRHELAHLRRILNDRADALLVCEYSRVRLNLEAISVDARRQPLGAAAKAGDFLEGFDIPGEDGFEDWLREQRLALAARAETEVRSPSAARPAVAPAPASNLAGADHHPSIAVLQFDHPPGEDDQAYFAEGVAEEIIAGLARSRLLRVTARQSSLTYDRRGATAARICADLGVRYLVYGQVRRLGEVLRVSVELVDGAQDRAVWSDRYDRPIADLFAVQDEITRAIIATIEPALLENEEAQVHRTEARDLTHWDLFIRGRWLFWRARFGDDAEVVTTLRAALALQPDHAPTISLLALCFMGDVFAGVARDPAASVTRAHQVALRAVSLDGSDAFAHYVLGTVLSFMGQVDQALAEQRRALELNPYLAVAAGELGRLHIFLGRPEEAIAGAERAIAASPNDPQVYLWYRTMALVRFVEGRYEEAARLAADACARGPQHFFLHFLLAACYAAAGRDAQARAAFAEGRRLRPRYPMAALRVGHPFADPAVFERFVAALRRAGWDGT